MSFSGWLPWGGAPWFIFGPDRIQINNNSDLPIENVQVINQPSERLQSIIQINSGEQKTIRFWKTHESSYVVKLTMNGQVFEDEYPYVEYGECVIFSFDGLKLSSRLEKVSDLCFWI